MTPTSTFLSVAAASAVTAVLALTAAPASAQIAGEPGVYTQVNANLGPNAAAPGTPASPPPLSFAGTYTYTNDITFLDGEWSSIDSIGTTTDSSIKLSAEGKFYNTYTFLLDVPSVVEFDTFITGVTGIANLEARLYTGTAYVDDYNRIITEYGVPAPPTFYPDSLWTNPNPVNGVGTYTVEIRGDLLPGYDITAASFSTLITVTAVPEASTLGLLAIGLAGCALWGRRRVAAS